MSEQPEASKPSEPKLCKMGCGIFPKDNATTKKGGNGGDPGKAEANVVESAGKSKNDSAAVVVHSGARVIKSEPSFKTDVASSADPPSPAKKKKKIKKKGYKSMMAGMLEGKSVSRDIEKEKEKLKEVTGGGHFTKIDKI